ncbi:MULTISPECIES: protein-glutamate methylesterase/protein-glutamine glutaminase [Cobetia]|nr:MULTISPECIES: chemotaxis response regulator protein-glutamate methylesterase [Cobetia]MDI4661029.1 chemotaxis response regulator protein-glutamate methylesterase [Cobetia sp. BMC6]MDL2191084.1 chemotaxis response regulator protein-glutamate methylesterase [Cobetia sp. LC6]NUJ55653.1 chemotaxis response regulator protein-glutamate methylesterase [Cobetia marina]BBO56509.1 chemotaxis response regulator protein-glutamate methylesterase 1 [Cobetia sp. AM6]
MIRVLCVDDSALIRELMAEIINAQPDMQVVATAPDPLVARDLIKRHEPDVLTLDVEMPRMDGLDFLERLMRLRPMPVVMVSSLTERGGEITLRALELGAVDFVSKPRLGIRGGMLEYAETIADKIRAAARARVRPAGRTVTPPSAGGAQAGTVLSNSTQSSQALSSSPLSNSVQSSLSQSHPCPSSLADRPVVAAASRRPLLSSEKLIAVGASTGGTEAIRAVLQSLPADAPAILVTQHMPPGFTRSFAERLNGLCRIAVKEAVHGERILPGHAYIAPGDAHLTLSRSGANYVITLDQRPPVNRHRPSVDVLFDSVARVAGRNAVGVILTGMGRDGARGLLQMREAGAHTIAQDEQSCVVYGMPREAVELGAAENILPLSRISGQLLHQVQLAGRSQRV